MTDIVVFIFHFFVQPVEEVKSRFKSLTIETSDQLLVKREEEEEEDPLIHSTTRVVNPSPLPITQPFRSLPSSPVHGLSSSSPATRSVVVSPLNIQSLPTTPVANKSKTLNSTQ